MHRPRHPSFFLAFAGVAFGVSWLWAARPARAGAIPIVTLSETGPDQEIPTYRSFFVAGDAAQTVQNAQAIVVRQGSPTMFGDDGSDCRTLLAELQLDPSISSAADGDDEGEEVDEGEVVLAHYPAGLHRAFELFPHAASGVRNAEVLVSAPWQRGSSADRRYQMLVPHDADFFSAGHGYCLFVVTAQRAQELDDATLGGLVDGLARRIVACGDKSSCSDDALADYEARAEKELEGSPTVAAGPLGEARAIAARLQQVARVELGASPGLIEALDHMEDRWHGKTHVMAFARPAVWAEAASDPFARAVLTLLARSAALLPQVRSDKSGGKVALYTPDGKVQVKALQLLDDGRSLRVASSRTPAGEQARVLGATTDALVVTPGITMQDLLELGRGRVRIDGAWTTLDALGDRISMLDQDTWSAEDSAYLAAASAHLKTLSNFVGEATHGVTCGPHASGAAEAPGSTAEAPNDEVKRRVGAWLACQQADAAVLTRLSDQLDDLVHEDQSWGSAKDKLVARSRRIVTLTTIAPMPMHVHFVSRTWVFSYVTPFLGYAGVLRPGESFGLFYLGAQVHLAPNPIDDVLWRDGLTARDLRRAVALEIGVAPYGGSFGPEDRYEGPGGLPPIFLGLAFHVIPYTSLTLGGTILDRKHSTLVEEQPHAIFAPFVGFSLQLNLPDLIRSASHPSSDTTVSR